jgi:hypothetical protein
MGAKSKTPKTEEPKAKLGRPMKQDYKPEYCQDIINYFKVTELYKSIPKFVSYYPAEKGSTAEHGGIKSQAFEIVATTPAHLQAWAREKGIDRQRIHVWRKKYPEFAEAVDICKDMRSELIRDNGLNGMYDARFAQMAAMNYAEVGWRMKTENKPDVNVTDVNLNDVWKEREKKIEEEKKEAEKKNKKTADGK